MNPLAVLKRATASWYDEAYLYALLSVVWILGQATVFLGPPMTAALFHVAHEHAHDRLVSWQKFKDGLVEYWRRGWMIGIVYDLVVLVTLVDLWFYLRHFQGMWEYMFFLWVYILIIWAGASLYLWPMAVGVDGLGLGANIQNALLLALSYPLYTFTLTLTIIVVGLVSILLPVIGILAFPAWAALVSEWAFVDRMKIAKEKQGRAG